MPEPAAAPPTAASSSPADPVDGPARRLADALQARGAEVATRATDAMFEDPYWVARFGARGRKHSYEDGAFHVTYLVEALRAGEPSFLGHYAVWLRSVLTARGMCTRHLIDHLDRLARAVEDLELTDAGVARTYVDVACHALRRTRESDGAAREVDEHEDDLVGRVLASTGSGERVVLDARRTREVVSFLVDALTTDDAGAFAAHVDFLRSFEAIAGGAEAVDGTLTALEGACDTTLSSAGITAARAMVRSARGAAASAASAGSTGNAGAP